MFALLVNLVSNLAPVDLQQSADFLERAIILFDIPISLTTMAAPASISPVVYSWMSKRRDHSADPPRCALSVAVYYPNSIEHQCFHLRLGPDVAILSLCHRPANFHQHINHFIRHTTTEHQPQPWLSSRIWRQSRYSAFLCKLNNSHSYRRILMMQVSLHPTR